MSSTRLKHIVIDEDNYRALKELGRAGDSFNDVLTNVLKKVNVQQNDSGLRAPNHSVARETTHSTRGDQSR